MADTKQPTMIADTMSKALPTFTFLFIIVQISLLFGRTIPFLRPFCKNYFLDFMRQVFIDKITYAIRQNADKP